MKEIPYGYESVVCVGDTAEINVTGTAMYGKRGTVIDLKKPRSVEYGVLRIPLDVMIRMNDTGEVIRIPNRYLWKVKQGKAE